jgi:hypothetical protein
MRDGVDKEHTKHHPWVLLGSLNTHVVHLTTRIALWPLVALRCLVPIPHLLHLLILHRGVGSSPLGAVVGIVTNLPTLVAVVARESARCTGPHGRASRSHRTFLLVCRAWSLWPRALELLSGVLKLLVLLWLVLVLLLLVITPVGPPGRNGAPSGEVKRGRMLLPDCPGVVAFLFSSPSSLRMDSKQMAMSSRCWKDGKVCDISWYRSGPTNPSMKRSCFFGSSATSSGA